MPTEADARIVLDRLLRDYPSVLLYGGKRSLEGQVVVGTLDTIAGQLVPAKRIIENGCNLTLASLGLVEPEKTDHAEPEDILETVARKERRILEIVEEMKALVSSEP